MGRPHRDFVGRRQRPAKQHNPQGCDSPDYRFHLRGDRESQSASQIYGMLIDTLLQTPEILSLKANEVLTAVIHGEEPAAEVLPSAVHAFYIVRANRTNIQRG